MIHNLITRGSTPLQQFELPFDASSLKDLIISYVQNNEVKLTKQLSDCETVGNVISFRLTQEETLAFSPDYLQIELKPLTVFGDVIPPQPILCIVQDIFNTEVIQ